jgi:predicted nucleic acid-binding Zn ribbon protein
MGASSAEIDQEIADTRRELDQTLGVLERRAAMRAKAFGRIAAGVAVGVAAVAIGVVIYRRRRHRNVAKQLHHALVDSMRDLPQEVTTRLKKRLPIKVVVTDRADEERSPSAWTLIAGKLAPTLVGSATGAVMSRLRGSPADGNPAE